MNTKELDNQYVAHAYGRFDVALTKGQGSTLYDEDGKKYIDFGSGIGVTAFGINDPVWTKAVEEQLHRVQHTSNLYYTAPCAKLAQLLCEKSGIKKVFFGNSGAEANEGAIKFARKYSFDKYGAGRSTIITLVNSFHGRTITTLAATGQDSFHTVFDPFTPGFKYCPANDIEALQAAATDDVCAVLFECVQGEGGVNNLSPTFVNAIAKLAKEKDILIAVDEVQTGNGRTGTYFAYQQYGITPDIVTTAKGLGYRLVICAFQPHTYSRTKALFSQFVEELKLPDVTVLAEIYAAREQNDIGISSQDLAREIPGAIYCSSLEKVTDTLASLAQPGDLILTVGAGDIFRAGEKLLERA